MIKEAVKKSIMDSFSRWIFQSDIKRQIEKQITEKATEKIDAFTTKIVQEIADKLNLAE